MVIKFKTQKKLKEEGWIKAPFTNIPFRWLHSNDYTDEWGYPKTRIIDIFRIDMSDDKGDFIYEETYYPLVVIHEILNISDYEINYFKEIKNQYILNLIYNKDLKKLLK